MAKHIDTLSIVMYLWGAFQLVIALGLAAFFVVIGGGLGVLGGTSGEDELMLMGGFYAVIGVFAAGVAALTAIPALAAGYGLKNRKSWGRILAMIVGALGMMNFPLGMMLGVFSFVVLLDSEAAAEFS